MHLPYLEHKHPTTLREQVFKFFNEKQDSYTLVEGFLSYAWEEFFYESQEFQSTHNFMDFKKIKTSLKWLDIDILFQVVIFNCQVLLGPHPGTQLS